MTYRSPLTGRPLVADTPHSLAAPGERWPVVDGIPYLRTDSEGLVAVALDHLDADCPDDALVALLTDQDAWWTGPATDLRELKRLVRERETLSLRAAMALLRMGPVADYFAHRWSDPTYLAGLALIEAHWRQPATAFELACGIGHYLRELSARGVACVGADVVFSKCWLAKHWVAPEAEYVVFDAAAGWPVETQRFDLVGCHDALYFLPDQPRVARLLRAAVAPGGVLAVSHLHNAAVAGGAMGPARAGAEWAALFPDAAVYDERELRRALLAADAPASTQWSDDSAIEAWSIVEADGGGADGVKARALTGGLAMPLADAVLKQNPLLDGDTPRWPSDRYRAEYGAAATWLTDAGDPARNRRVLDLPARW
ncbi:class I SAM-dependent methyltransferase [Sphingomonas faeni]|uniref:class I SAM-dependent methyltransferase n=1 Tax=Sphingomonas faeni TaxID=185950 RepID=UPI002786CD01|nr:class I SAM-dependent methyltransferase [Sphingomonas faeni]MDQ0837073.1 SAM-dependent methyltransferase [Sphingomonas faeni]